MLFGSVFTREDLVESIYGRGPSRGNKRLGWRCGDSTQSVKYETRESRIGYRDSVCRECVILDKVMESFPLDEQTRKPSDDFGYLVKNLLQKVTYFMYFNVFFC